MLLEVLLSLVPMLITTMSAAVLKEKWSAPIAILECVEVRYERQLTLVLLKWPRFWTVAPDLDSPA